MISKVEEEPSHTSCDVLMLPEFPNINFPVLDLYIFLCVSEILQAEFRWKPTEYDPGINDGFDNEDVEMDW